MNKLVSFIAIAIMMLVPAQSVAGNSHDGSDDLLYIEAQTIKSGDYFEIPVYFRNANAYSAFQCDILIPEGVDVEKDEDGEFCLSIEESRFTPVHMMTSATVDDGAIRVVCYANPTKDIKGNDGALFYIKARAKKGFAGEVGVRMYNICFSTAKGVEKELESTEAVINVVAPINVFAINDATVTDCYTLQLPVELKNESNIISFDAELCLPDGVSLLGVEADTARCNESFSVTTLQNDSVINISLASNDSAAIAGSEGALFYLNLAKEPGSADVNEIALRNITATDDDGSVIAIEDTKCTVTFVINSYTVTFMVDGEVYDSVTVQYGDTVTAVAEPVKEGHTFSGWSDIPATMPACDVTVEGTFSVNSYIVTFVVDGEVYDSVTVQYGDTVTAVAEPVKEGHTFSGWSDIPATMPACDVTVEGTFSVNSYTVTFMVDGEVYDSVTVQYGDTVTAVAEPVKEGHTFSGWSDIPATMPACDVTVEGTFSVNSYTVTFMVDGEVYDSVTVQYGAEIELPTPPEKEGYIFVGWSDVPATMPAKDIVVEAVFEVDTTGIDEVKGENAKLNIVYNLQGNRVLDVENIESGVYIINGKKVFVK